MMRYDEERWLLSKIERVAPALVSLSMQPVTKNSQRIVMIRLAIRILELHYCYFRGTLRTFQTAERIAKIGESFSEPQGAPREKLSPTVSFRRASFWSLYKARSRIYRHRCLQVMSHCSALFEIYNSTPISFDMCSFFKFSPAALAKSVRWNLLCRWISQNKTDFATSQNLMNFAPWSSQNLFIPRPKKESKRVRRA